MADLFLSRRSDVRMAVLEEKLSVYEDLSREMLSKLEVAVDKISEANQNVARILVRHEERLDQTLQSDATIMKLLDEIKEQRKQDMVRVNDEIKEIKRDVNSANSKISDISRYRWIIAGAIMLFSFFVAESDILSNTFTPKTGDSTPEIRR